MLIMLLSKDQSARFWREWSAVVAQNEWPKDKAESERKDLLKRAGFDSLTLVDRTEGFSRVLKELAALRDDLAGMLHADDNGRRVLLHGIHALSRQIVSFSPHLGNPGAYLRSIMLDRWGHFDTDRLSVPELEQLRNTLAARAGSKKRQAALRQTDNCPF